MSIEVISIKYLILFRPNKQTKDIELDDWRCYNKTFYSKEEAIAYKKYLEISANFNEYKVVCEKQTVEDCE